MSALGSAYTAFLNGSATPDLSFLDGKGLKELEELGREMGLSADYKTRPRWIKAIKQAFDDSIRSRVNA